ASFCSIGWGPLKNDVIVSVTGLVMPLIVRSPSMLTGWPSSNTTLFDVNVAVGNCAVSRKSSLWICWSNSSKPVSMEVMSMVTSTSAVSASLSRTTVPEVLLKRRICLDNPMWLYEKRGNVWLWSMTYVAGAANAGPATTEANNAAIRVFFMVFPVKSSKKGAKWLLWLRYDVEVDLDVVSHNADVTPRAFPDTKIGTLKGEISFKDTVVTVFGKGEWNCHGACLAFNGQVAGNFILLVAR